MKSKRLLAVLVALCLLVGALAPSASAAHAHGNAAGVSTGNNMSNDRLVSNGSKPGVPSLRGENGLVSTAADGKWIINASNLKPWQDAFNATLPDCIAELREAAKIL